MLAKVNKPHNIIVYGNSGTGKTTFACSHANEKHLVALLDIDNKAEHQINIQDKVKKGWIDIYPISAPIFGGGDFDYIKNISNIPKGYETIVKTISSIAKTKPKKYSTIVIDSGSRLVQHLISYIPAINAKTQMTQQLWGIFYNELVNRIIRVNTIPVNIIWIFHEKIIMDEITKAKSIHISIPGQLGTDIPSFFNEVYNTRIITLGEKYGYVCLTHATNVYIAKTSGNLKNTVLQDMSKILEGLA